MMIKPDDLELICTTDGAQWFQRKQTESHITDVPKPRIGDVLVEVDENGDLVGRRVIFCGESVTFGSPFIFEVLRNGRNSCGKTLTERNPVTRKLRRWRQH